MVIDFLNTEFTVNEGQGTVTVTLVKSGLTTIDYDVELMLFPGSAGELYVVGALIYSATYYRLASALILVHRHRMIS